MTAIDQMARVYRWACSEKRRTLEDLLRLAERLRADMGRLGGPSATTSGEGQSAESHDIDGLAEQTENADGTEYRQRN